MVSRNLRQQRSCASDATVKIQPPPPVNRALDFSNADSSEALRVPTRQLQRHLEYEDPKEHESSDIEMDDAEMVDVLD